jgi:hypothetical protein
MAQRRFTPGTLMALIAAFGALFAWVRWQGSWYRALRAASYSGIAWGLSFPAAFAFARRFGSAVRSSGMRTLVEVLRAVFLVAALYLAWAHIRTLNFVFIDLPHGFPYPDRAIVGLERWFDARRPAPPGSIKLHGEFYTVAFLLGSLVLALSAITGYLSGLIADRPDDLMTSEPHIPQGGRLDDPRARGQ